MNFSALRRRLNPFEKREKKVAKPKYTVYEKESPPTLNKNEKCAPRAVLKNSEEIAAIFPDPQEKPLPDKQEQHMESEDELRYVLNDKGMGDYAFKHAVITKVNYKTTPGGIVYYKSDPNKSQVTNNEGFHVFVPKESNTTSDDKERKMISSFGKEKTHSVIKTRSPSKKTGSLITRSAEAAKSPKRKTNIPKPCKVTTKNDASPDVANNKVGTGLVQNCSFTAESPSDQSEETELTEESFSQDIVSVAFKYAIIPEKLQTSEHGLEQSLYNLFELGRRHASHRRKLTDPIASLSPILEEHEKYIKEKNNKKSKKALIQKLAHEAAYIQNECDQINYAVDSLTASTELLDENLSLCQLRSLSHKIKNETANLVKYMQRLRGYYSQRNEMPCIIVYCDPVAIEVTETLSKVINRFRTYGTLNQQIEIMIKERTEANEARRRSEMEPVYKPTAKQLSIIGKQESKRNMPEKTVNSPEMKQQKTKNARSQQVIPQTAELTAQTLYVKKTPQPLKQTDTATKEVLSTQQTQKTKGQAKSVTVKDTKKTTESNTTNEQTTNGSEQKTVNKTPQTKTPPSAEKTTSAVRKRSWKANRASDLRCAPSPVNGPMGRRIITPLIKPSQREQTGHDVRNTESTLDIQESAEDIPCLVDNLNGLKAAMGSEYLMSGERENGDVQSNTLESSLSKLSLDKRSQTKRRDTAEKRNGVNVATSSGGDGQQVYNNEGKFFIV